MKVLGGICVQCALREFVEMLEKGLDPHEQPATGAGLFEGDPEAHTQAVHGGVAKARLERRDLERRAHDGFEKLKAKKMALARNAHNN